MIRKIAAALAVVALGLTLAPPAQAALPPIETSRAVDTVYSDMRGKIIVRVKYRDYGPLGVKPVKACVHDDPIATTHTIQLWVDLPGKTVYMGEYKPGDKKCRNLPLWAKKIVKGRTWVGYGNAIAMKILGVNVFADRFYAKGYMR